MKNIRKFLEYGRGFLRFLRSSYTRDSVYLGDYKALTQTIFGHKLIIDTRDLSLAPHLLLEGLWEMHTTKIFLQKVKYGMKVVEIGSNFGYYTVLAASRVGPSGHVYAFEANGNLCDFLFQNVSINWYLDRVTVVNKVVADKARKLVFRQLKRHYGDGSIINFTPEFLEKYKDEAVPTEHTAIALDSYFSNKSTMVDFIKMDAEGSEHHILKGMKGLIECNNNIKIISEFSPELMSGAGGSPKQFLEALIMYGFELKYIDKSSKLIKATVGDLLSMPFCELFLERRV